MPGAAEGQGRDGPCAAQKLQARVVRDCLVGASISSGLTTSGFNSFLRDMLRGQ